MGFKTVLTPGMDKPITKDDQINMWKYLKENRKQPKNPSN